MLSETSKTRHIRQYGVYLLKHEVFRDLSFPTKQQRDIAYDSYVINMDSLIEHALVTGADLKVYFKQLRTMLLQSKHVQKKRRQR